jgi:hypothetical protein
MPANCRSCFAPIVWVELPSGKRLPLDPSAAPGRGNVRVGDNRKAAVLSGPSLAIARERNEPLFISHFATCSHAAQHRSPRT